MTQSKRKPHIIQEMWFFQHRPGNASHTSGSTSNITWLNNIAWECVQKWHFLTDAGHDLSFVPGRCNIFIWFAFGLNSKNGIEKKNCLFKSSSLCTAIPLSSKFSHVPNRSFNYPQLVRTVDSLILVSQCASTLFFFFLSTVNVSLLVVAFVLALGQQFYLAQSRPGRISEVNKFTLNCSSQLKLYKHCAFHLCTLVFNTVLIS